MTTRTPAPVPVPSPPPGPRATATSPNPVAPGQASTPVPTAPQPSGPLDASPNPLTRAQAATPVPLPAVPTGPIDRAPGAVTPGPGTGTSGNATVTITIPVNEIALDIGVIPSSNVSNNVVVTQVKPGGNNGAIQFNSNGTFGGSANLVFTQGGLFVGGVPTSLDANGIITARNEYRFGVWSGFDGPSNDAWGRVRLGSFNSSQTFYGFNGDPAITNPNRTVVITNEEQDIHQAMVLMDGLAYNAPSGEGTIFGVSVNQTNADYRASTGFELGWKKLIDVTNKGNVKIGGSLQITPSFQTSPPANNTVGIRFADGTFQYTAATGGVSTIAVQDEGSNVVASANTINFVGAGVTASNVGGVATITIPSSSLVNTVYDAGFANTVTLNYNNGQWQNYEPDDAVLNVTISNIPTGGEMTVFLRYGSDNTSITWTGSTSIFWENNDDTPSQTLGQRDVLTVKNNGNYYFAKLSKNYS